MNWAYAWRRSDPHTIIHQAVASADNRCRGLSSSRTLLARPLVSVVCGTPRNPEASGCDSQRFVAVFSRCQMAPMARMLRQGANVIGVMGPAYAIGSSKVSCSG